MYLKNEQTVDARGSIIVMIKIILFLFYIKWIKFSHLIKQKETDKSALSVTVSFLYLWEAAKQKFLPSKKNGKSGDLTGMSPSMFPSCGQNMWPQTV